MREIKFRAWDMMIKEMLDWDHPIWASFQCKFSEMQESGYELEQFTGLHDKNGREIYEGDIVTWGYGETAVRFGTIDEEDASGNEYQVTGWLVSDCTLNSDCEIIGNIHENPDLVK